MDQEAGNIGRALTKDAAILISRTLLGTHRTTAIPEQPGKTLCLTPLSQTLHFICFFSFFFLQL
jgi:hypothetical protein